MSWRGNLSFIEILKKYCRISWYVYVIEKWSDYSKISSCNCIIRPYSKWKLYWKSSFSN